MKVETIKIEKRKISDLIRAEYNPRKITKVQILELKEGLDEFGLVTPIVVNELQERYNVIIGGHQRLKILEDLGYTEVDCSIVSLPLNKERKLNIKLNKNGGSFDNDLLKEYFDYEELTEWGFTPDELFNKEETTADGLIDDDEIPEVIKYKVKRGDIWKLGEHRVMCGDSTKLEDVQALMNGQYADILITDPPYNVDYTGKTKDKLKIQNDKMSDEGFREFLKDTFLNADSVLKDGGVFYIWHADSEGYNFRGACHDVNWNIRQCIIWNKNSMVMGRQDYHWKHEPCLYGWKEGAAHYWGSDRKQTTILNFDRPTRSKLHPTTKPIELMEYQIINNSKANEIVLDLFGGSGSTLIASEKLHRKCNAMELDEKYCDVIIERWEQFTGLKAEKIN
tara:strand:- start:52 stop:1233 length:1182 start_codon:yes stop_codon:yes gene_type:complete